MLGVDVIEPSCGSRSNDQLILLANLDDGGGRLATGARPMIPLELIQCILGDRAPTERELSRVARHIWLDLSIQHSTLGWSRLALDAPDRLAALRHAYFALHGAPDLHPVND